jgi:hypothetical protein
LWNKVANCCLVWCLTSRISYFMDGGEGPFVKNLISCWSYVISIAPWTLIKKM